MEKLILDHGGVMREKGGNLKDFPATDRFTPGLYIREIFMPAGSVVVSKIHLTEHPFVVSKGRCFVYLDGGGWEEIRAPHTGITKPGSRRLLVMFEDTIWTTFHVTNLTNVSEIEDEIIADYQNPLLEGGAS